MRTIALRLGPDADLKAELLALAARERLRAGWMLTCLGSLSGVRPRLAGGTNSCPKTHAEFRPTGAT